MNDNGHALVGFLAICCTENEVREEESDNDDDTLAN